jgi:hypothetical protein
MAEHLRRAILGEIAQTGRRYAIDLDRMEVNELREVLRLVRDLKADAQRERGMRRRGQFWR